MNAETAPPQQLACMSPIPLQFHSLGIPMVCFIMHSAYLSGGASCYPHIEAHVENGNIQTSTQGTQGRLLKAGCWLTHSCCPIAVAPMSMNLQATSGRPLHLSSVWGGMTQFLKL